MQEMEILLYKFCYFWGVFFICALLILFFFGCAGIDLPDFSQDPDPEFWQRTFSRIWQPDYADTRIDTIILERKGETLSGSFSSVVEWSACCTASFSAPISSIDGINLIIPYTEAQCTGQDDCWLKIWFDGTEGMPFTLSEDKKVLIFWGIDYKLSN